MASNRKASVERMERVRYWSGTVMALKDLFPHATNVGTLVACGRAAGVVTEGEARSLVEVV